MVGTAVTALTAGAAGFEGAAAGVAASGAGSAGASSAGASAGSATAGSARALTAAGTGNQPAPPQQAPIAASSTGSFAQGDGSLTLEGHAEQIRSSIGDAMGTDEANDESSGAISVPARDSGVSQVQSRGSSATAMSVARSSASTRRGPSVHRYNLGTWTAYHAARIAAGSLAGATRRTADQD
jgi:type IV secretion system protein TrbL